MKGKKTGGRIRGSKNKAPNEIKEMIKARVDFKLVLDKLIEAVDGIKVQEKGSVYLRPPDVSAAKLLLEYGFGKPTQVIDADLSGETIIKIVRT